MSKRKAVTPKLYATAGVYEVKGKQFKDTFAQVYESAILSEAYLSLVPRVQMLYIFMRLREMHSGKPNREYSKEHPMWDKVKGDDCFFFPQTVAALYSSYYALTPSRLYRDIRVLVEHGFIDVVVSGRNTRTKSVYKYSERWKEYKAEPETDRKRRKPKKTDGNRKEPTETETSTNAVSETALVDSGNATPLLSPAVDDAQNNALNDAQSDTPKAESIPFTGDIFSAEELEQLKKARPDDWEKVYDIALRQVKSGAETPEKGRQYLFGVIATADRQG